MIEVQTVLNHRGNVRLFVLIIKKVHGEKPVHVHDKNLLLLRHPQCKAEVLCVVFLHVVLNLELLDSR